MNRAEAWHKLTQAWYPNDEFGPWEWQVAQYYQTKFAVVEKLQPTSICEIGVGAGYSAFTFLCAAPDASYLGIDNATDWTVEWRAQVAPNAKFIVADSQQMHLLPADVDLVHVDGDRSFIGRMHDIQLAFSNWNHQHPRYVLVTEYGSAEVQRACDYMASHSATRTLRIDDGLYGSMLLWREPTLLTFPNAKP